MSENPKRRLDPDDLSLPPLKKHQDGTLARSPLNVNHCDLDDEVVEAMTLHEVSDTAKDQIINQIFFAAAILVSIVENVVGLDQKFARVNTCARLLKQYPELHHAVAEAYEQGSFQSIREL
ncbi:hypothetical protein H0H81_012564, partial [Sphagnurus paluster]